LILLLILATLIQVLIVVAYVFTVIYLKVYEHSNRDVEKSELPFISIIIVAHDDLEMLAKNLPHFFALDYPDYEVVLVNDRSTDGTQEWLNTLALKHDKLTIVSVSKDVENPGKKTAIVRGIACAKSNFLVFSDADCYPASNDLLLNFGKSFSKGYELILGFGLFESTDKFSNILYRIESVKIALRYSLAAIIGRPYMGVGRSMGYTKSLFTKVSGFTSHSHIKSGDDDLFVQSIPRGTKTKVVPQALTISETPSGFMSWFLQKQRHLSTGKLYRFHTILVLGLIELSELLSIIGVFTLFLVRIDSQWFVLFSLILLRLGLLAVLISTFNSLIHYRSVKLKEIWLELFLSILNPLFSVASQLRQSEEWIRRK